MNEILLEYIDGKNRETVEFLSGVLTQQVFIFIFKTLVVQSKWVKKKDEYITLHSHLCFYSKSCNSFINERDPFDFIQDP